MFQVKSLCEKAKEILMEESNVQVWHADSCLSLLGVACFSIDAGGYMYSFAGSKGRLNYVAEVFAIAFEQQHFLLCCSISVGTFHGPM